MFYERLALLAILSLSVTILGCTSSTPTTNGTAKSVSTTKAVNENEIASLKSELAILAREQKAVQKAKQFVNTMRRWRDHRNQFSTNAELVAVSVEKRSITLLKENGVTVDVSIDQLSKHDRNYLTQAVHTMRRELVKEN